MKTVTVVGSGASAVHFSQTALEAGWKVRMLDVGRPRPVPVLPGASFSELLRQHDDPTSYFLGEQLQSVLLPGEADEYYGFPPHREYIFEGHPQYELQSRGFAPLQSFAKGGLAEAWTGGSFALNEDELSDFPFGYAELGPYYDLVAKRIGILGMEDDLAPFHPVHKNLSTPFDLDPHGQKLIDKYTNKRAAMHKLGVFMGRSRMAVLAEDRGARKACTQLGRCLWGCPTESLYTPALTLAELQQHEDFEYQAGLFVTHFELSSEGKVKAVVAQPVAGGEPQRLEVERLALAAGSLASSKIVLDSVYRAQGERWTLEGLMDNRQVLVPFVNLGMVGRSVPENSYQYHQLAIALPEQTDPRRLVHGLVTTLKTTLMHPIVQNVPLDLRAALDVFRTSHAALGLVNVNFCDDRRSRNKLSLEPLKEAGRSRLHVDYTPAPDEDSRIRQITKRVRKALRKLGCVVPPGMQHTRPMGASVHYAGTLPMMAKSAPRSTDPTGRSYDFDNLWVVDGATFPFLPAKNLTFSLMANAARIAAVAFD